MEARKQAPSKGSPHPFRDRNLPIFHIQHISDRKGASCFLPGTPGAAFHANVSPLPEETIIQKNFPNSFRNTDLLTRVTSSPLWQSQERGGCHA